MKFTQRNRSVGRDWKPWQAETKVNKQKGQKAQDDKASQMHVFSLLQDLNTQPQADKNP